MRIFDRYVVREVLLPLLLSLVLLTFLLIIPPFLMGPRACGSNLVSVRIPAFIIPPFTILTMTRIRLKFQCGFPPSSSRRRHR